MLNSNYCTQDYCESCIFVLKFHARRNETATPVDYINATLVTPGE